MLLINQNEVDQHNARLATVKSQHAAVEASIEAEAPQPIDFTQLDANGTSLTLSNGVVVMPGDYYNETLGIAISKDDTVWVAPS